MLASKFSSLFVFEYPGNLLCECGTCIPPSTVPFKTPNTLDPVVVLFNPTSNIALNGLFTRSPSPI